jgi:hypothetical protein
MFIRGDCTDPYPFWYRIYNLLAVSIEYAKAYVHLLIHTSDELASFLRYPFVKFLMRGGGKRCGGFS